ncbi:MAG: TetR/AcrR family transcriptional regulator [Burkholderiaceae bacterium]
MNPTSTRARVLDAAAQVFLKHGFAQASMDTVRQEAGVSNGSLYHHFPSKAQLADGLYASTLRDFHATLLVALRGKGTAEAAVKGLIRAYVQWVVRHPDRAQLLHKLRRTGDMADASGETNAANSEAFGALVQWFTQKLAAGELRVMPFPVWMALVFSPAMALTPHWVRRKTPTVPPAVRAALEHGAWMACAP